MGLHIKRGITSKYKRIIAASVAAFALIAQPLLSSNIPSAFADSAVVSISTVAELRSAIENQADGQTWSIQAGEYGLARFNTITAEGQTGWYFPITANNLTINGIGNPTIYGTGFSANGNWSSQNFVSVFGDNVTINGLTLMPKVEPNKTLEVLGSDFTLTNTVFAPNTRTDQTEYSSIVDPSDPTWSQDAKQWGGSLYFNHSGNHTVQNVTIHNAGVSFRYAPAGTHITFSNVKVVNATNIDWINGYRFSSGFNTSGNTTAGLPQVEYHVSASLNNLNSVLSKLQDGDTLVLDSDLPVSEQLTLDKAITVQGNGFALKPTFAKTSNSNNSVLAIQSDNVIVENLVVDGVQGTNLHGINTYEAHNVILNNVTVKDNDYSGLNVNRSTVTVDSIVTANNGWHGIDVDKPGAVLTVLGSSTHNELLPIYVDDVTVGQVIDSNHQYGSKDNVKQAGDRVYGLKPATPVLQSPSNNGYTTTNDFYFEWSDVVGATSYEFQNSKLPTTNANGVLTSINYTATNLGESRLHSVGAADGSVRYWQVRAVDANGIKGDWTSPWKMTIDMTAPATPVLETPANNAYLNNNSFWFEWSDASGATSYEFQASQSSSTDSNGSLNSGVWHGDASGNQPTESRAWSAGANGTWYWQVRAVDVAGNKSPWTSVWKLTIDMAKPTAPTITAPTANQEFDSAPQTIRAEWTAANDVNAIKQYQIEYSYDRNGTPTIDYRQVSGSRLYRDQSLSGTVLSPFTIRVRAQDSADNWSDWSAPVTYYYGVSAPNAGSGQGSEGDGDGNSEGTDSGDQDGDDTSTDTESNTGSPTTPQNPSSNESDESSEKSEQDTTSNTSNQLAQLFIPGSPAVLGAQDPNEDSNDGGASTPLDTNEDVLGTSTEPKAASTAGSDFMGLAWYWWLAILAALIGLFWIIAARLRRSAVKS